jgi:hypothetical protein
MKGRLFEGTHRRGWGKGEGDRRLIELIYIIYYENSIIKPTKNCSKRGGGIKKE